MLRTINGANDTLDSSFIPKEIREKTKSCFECGICTASCPMAELIPTHFNPRSLLQKATVEPEKALNEVGPWLCAWCYRCFESCPQGLKPPEIFQLLKDEAVKRGLSNGFKEAVMTIKEKVPFSVVCWYTCFHHERAGTSDEDKAEALKVLTTGISPKKTIIDPTVKIAVVGSGPAGFTAAFELAEKGYSVTIFEALSELGGMLRRSMPKYRLPSKALEHEIQRCKGAGVELKTNVKIGKDVSFSELWKRGYKVVFVAVGAHKSRKLGIEGEELDGIVDALSFLSKVNMKEKVTLGKRVGVIGGGNVAVDAARTALRHGAEEVIILYRRSRVEMPANPWEVAEAEEEGVKLEFLVAPKKVLRRQGKAAGLECVRTKLDEPDETGRRRPVHIEGSEFSLHFDTLIFALGETAETGFLPKQIKTNRDHSVWVNPYTMETSMKGVFAGGDVVTGPATVIEATLAGKEASQSIHQYLVALKKEEGKNHDD